eukprot:1795960-Prorocentrum_lima.AAC.1
MELRGCNEGTVRLERCNWGGRCDVDMGEQHNTIMQQSKAMKLSTSTKFIVTMRIGLVMAPFFVGTHMHGRAIRVTEQTCCSSSRAINSCTASLLGDVCRR